jgi:hypothetical protein
MIQPLRTVHRGTFVILAFVLPAVLMAGLGARRLPRPSRPQVLELSSSAHLARKSDALWQTHAIQSEFYTDSNRSGDIQVILHPEHELNEPDVLLYWSVEQPTGDALPAASQLLGPVAASTTFTVPPGVERGGYLILFSLPYQRLIDIAKVEALP